MFAPSFWSDWGDLSTMLIAGVVVLVVAFLAFRAYRAHLAARSVDGDGRYQRLTQDLAVAVKAAGEQGQRNAEALAGLEKRLGAIETLLRQVE